MNRNIISVLLIVFWVNLFISCEKEEESYSSPKNTTANISKPTVQISSHFANGSCDGWYVIGTVTTGGDNPNNVNCYLEWSKFTKKQSGSVTLTNRSRMKVTNSSKTRVQFKSEHAGINKGNYIYYRMVGRNSKYEASTSTEYMVAQ